MCDKPVVADEIDEIIVDPASIKLDAVWEKQTSAWMRMALRVLTCVRHQTAALAIFAIVVLLRIIHTSAQDIWILTVAMGLIAAVAVSTELIDKKYDGCQRRKNTTEPRHAAQNQAVDRRSASTVRRRVDV